MTPSGKVYSLVLRRCASASWSGLPANSGLQWDQFNQGIGAGLIGCVGETTGCAGGAGSFTGGTEGTIGGITGMAGVWVVLHLPYLIRLQIIL